MKKLLSTIMTAVILLMPGSILTFDHTCSAQPTNSDLVNPPIAENLSLTNTSSSAETTNIFENSPSYFLGDFLKKSSYPKISQFGNWINSCNFSGNNIIEKSKYYFSKSITLSALSTGVILLNSFSSHSKNLMYTLYAMDILERKIYDAYEIIKSFIPKKEYSVQEYIKKLNTELESIKGQEVAKRKIQKILCGIAHEKNLTKSNKEHYGHGDILYFAGASGVGKTFAAKHIAKALSDVKPFVISASEIDTESTYASPVEQLFNLRRYKGERDDMGINENSSLVKYICRNKNGIVIINEYDKMWSKSFDEIFRTIADDGVISIKGQTIDCSGITFIITSNESTGSVNGGNQDKDEEVDDGTGSRTTIKHDKSFLNRVNIVEFENLSESEYEEIAISEYKDKLINYWKNYAGVELCFGDTFKHVATKAISENKGARTIKHIMDGLSLELGEFINSSKFKASNNSSKILISYDENTDTFSLNQEIKEVAVTEEKPSKNETTPAKAENNISNKESTTDNKSLSTENTLLMENAVSVS